MEMLNKINIDVVCHIILGLPEETERDMINSVRYAAKRGIKGIKIQLLHILKGTKLGEIYEKTLLKY